MKDQFSKACGWAIFGFVIGLAVSKFSAHMAYKVGLDTAINDSDKVCLAWWFNGDAKRLNQAKHWMCGRN